MTDAVHNMCGFCTNCRNMMYDFPKVVTLCGSTRFAAEFAAARRRETWAGNIVLGPEDLDRNDPNSTKKKLLDELHLKKVYMADEVLILNVGGYIGESTARELEYAIKHGKPIRYLEEPVSNG